MNFRSHKLLNISPSSIPLLLNKTLSNKSHILALAACLLLLMSYVLSGLLGIQAHVDPTEMDTVAYLRSSHQIHETGGILNHIPNCLTGVYKEATRHPLYLLLLSPWAEPSLAFFVQAKIIGFFIGGIFLTVLFGIVYRLQGILQALLVGALVVMNATFLRLSTMVVAEGLLALFFMFFWYFAIQGFKHSRKWVLAGTFAGLAFMTKSIAIFLLPIFGITCIWVYKNNLGFLVKSRNFWLFFVMFMVISSPLLIRNIHVYGTPLYSESRGVLWVDKYSDFSREKARRGEYSLKNYMETHSAGEVFENFWQGLVKRNPMMLSDGLKPFKFWTKVDLSTLRGFHQKTVPWQGIWAFLLLVLFGYDLWRNRFSVDSVLTLTAFVLFYFFIGWYSKIFSQTPPTRLWYILLFPIIFHATRALFCIFSSIEIKGFEEMNRKICGYVIMVLILSVYCLGLGFNYDWSKLNLSQSFKIHPLIDIHFQWIGRTVPAGQAVLVGNHLSSMSFYYGNRVNANIKGWPKLDSMKELQHYVRKDSIKFGILDVATVIHRNRIFSDYFQIQKGLTLQKKRDLPRPWQILPRGRGIPPLFEYIYFEN